MILPLSALLYKVTEICNYELQNVNMALSFGDVHLFEANVNLPHEENHLFFLTDEMNVRILPDLSYPKDNTVFLCYCSRPVEEISSELYDFSVVYLFPKHNESFPFVFNKVLNIFKDFGAWDQSFHVELLHGTSMQKLLDITAPLLSHSMLILDHHKNIIGTVRKEDDSYMNEFLDDGLVSEKKLKLLNKDNSFPLSFNSNSLFIFPYTTPEGKSHYGMCYSLTDSNRLYGYALIFCCNNHPSVSYQYLMDMVIDNLMLYFQQSSSYSHRITEQYELILANIMENPDFSLHKLNSLLSETDALTFDGNFILARVYFENSDNISLSFVSWNIKTTFPALMPFISNEKLYILYSAQSEKDVLNTFVPDEKLSQFVYSFSSRLKHCTISKPFFTLDMLTDAARQCELAHDYLPDSLSEAPIVYYKDCVSNFLQHKILSKEKQYLFSSQYYEALKKYDTEHGTKLCYILYEYLVNFKSVNNTAKACFLHRNTVLNSIKKAFSIIDNNFNNFDDAVFFVLNYRNDH